MTSLGFVLALGLNVASLPLLPCAVFSHPPGAVFVERAQGLRLAAPLHSGPQEAQRVVDVFLPAPLAVAGVRDDGDVRRADDGPVSGIPHWVVQLADDPTGGLVDDRPQRRKRDHVAARI